MCIHTKESEDYNNKTILITGGAGFIGSNLALYFQNHFPDAHIVVFDCFRSGEKLENGNLKSLGHYKNLIGFFGEIVCGDLHCDIDLEKLEKYDFDYIFHQAAISDTREYNEELVMRTNVNSFNKLLELAYKKKAKMIYASSACTYGRSKSPQKVGQEKPECPYGFSKFAMDQIAYRWMKNHDDMHIVGLRYFNVYGRGEYFKGSTASMVIQLGHQILSGKKPRLFTGSHKIFRDFVFIDDVLQSNLLAASSCNSGVYNVGTGQPRSFQDIVDILQNELGTKLTVEYFDNPYDGYQTHTQADIFETQNILGYYPQFSLEEGIRTYLPEIKRLYEEEVLTSTVCSTSEMRNKLPYNISENALSSMSSKKIAVFGDLMIDHYLWGDCERLSPEAPVPVVNVTKESSTLGGAGNVVKNLIALGSEVDLFSVIGDCKTSSQLKMLLGQIRVPLDGLVQSMGRIGSKKTRVLASQQQVVRIDSESKENIDEVATQKLLSKFRKNITHYSIILISDYNKGVCTPQLTQEIIRIANENEVKVLIDPKGSDYSKYKGAYLLTPNLQEASKAVGIDIVNDKSLKEAMIHLKNDCGLHASIITMSENGIAMFDDKLQKFPVMVDNLVDVTGAGDTVLASLGFALAAAYSLKEAVQFANLAAGVVVGKVGSATATTKEIEDHRARLKKKSMDQFTLNSDHNILNTTKELEPIVADLKRRQQKIVFTNGCFDILHAGHVKYLQEARSYGDILILGLNSDESVSRLKGKTRPINTQEDRAAILASLTTIDYVVIFDEDTPYKLISMIMPDILVKGGDYEGKEVIGSDLVNIVKLVTFVDGKSTTKTIERIRQANM